MSQLEVDKIIPQSGTTLTIGESGDTISFASGVLPSLESLTITGDLTVDTTTLKVDSTNNRVGIGTSSPASLLEVEGTSTTAKIHINSTSIGTSSFDGSGAGLLLTASGMNTSSKFTPAIQFGSTDANFTTTNPKTFAAINGEATQTYSTDDTGGGALVFYTTPNSPGTGQTTTERMRIDSSGNVGIGTTSPSAAIDFGTSRVDTNGYDTGAIRLYDNDAGAIYGFGISSSQFNFRSGSRFVWWEDTTEHMRIASGGFVGIGTNNPQRLLHVEAASGDVYLRIETEGTGSGDHAILEILTTNTSASSYIYFGDSADINVGMIRYVHSVDEMRFYVNASEVIRIASDGDTTLGTNIDETLPGVNNSDRGLSLRSSADQFFVSSASNPMYVNRTVDGSLVSFRSAGTAEGSISVSGSTVSYNGFTGTHWSRLADNSKPTILKGTILESLDEMMDWYQVQFDITKTDDEGKETTRTQRESYALGDGESVGDVITYNFEGTDYQATIIQEGDVKHTKSKVSDTVDAKNVYGVFMDWDNDDDSVNDMYVAQTGSYIIRINGSETVSKGDLIQSNGDGTGKVQSDDIIRASTVAKVISSTKVETYDDGSYIVPCTLHC